jgi:hypothetical protein
VIHGNDLHKSIEEYTEDLAMRIMEHSSENFGDSLQIIAAVSGKIDIHTANINTIRYCQRRLNIKCYSAEFGCHITTGAQENSRNLIKNVNLYQNMSCRNLLGMNLRMG